MTTIDFRFTTEAAALLDASDDLLQLLEQDGELSPALRALLLALDDAITRAFADRVAA